MTVPPTDSERAPGAQPPPLPTGAPPVRSPLSEADDAVLRAASMGRRAVRRAAWVARSSAVTELGIAVLAVAFTICMFSWTNLLIAAALSVIGLVELAGYHRTRRGEPSAAVMLALNQLALLAVIVVYCSLQIAHPPKPEDLAELQQLGLDPASVTRLFYGLVIALSVLFQGGMALYYFTRRRALERYRRDTPEWAQRLIRELNL